MITGDATVNHDATVICCTAEILANIGLRDGANAPRGRRRYGRVPLLLRPLGRRRLINIRQTTRNLHGIKIPLDSLIIMEYVISMITTVTGKNQITIPAAIANRIGLKSGSRIDWQLSSNPDEIRCIVLPEPSVIAASLRGAGKRFLKPGLDPSAALLVERSADESARSTHLK